MARLDNRGTPARGPLQYLGSVTANNLQGIHDAFTLTYAGVVPTQELNYVSAAYRQVLTAEGLAAFVNVSYGFGHPGTAQLELLNYKTKTLYGDAGLSYPWIRSREKNLALSALVFGSDSDSDVLDTRFNEDRIRGTRIKVDADMADAWRGINQVNITFSQGINGLDSSLNGNPLASRADGRVDFSKIEGTVSRIQPLFGPISMFLAGYGQYATTSLLSPEQCSFGGRFFGRAYDPAQLLGDSCAEAIVEFRYDLPKFADSVTQAQLYTYSDYGKLWVRGPGTFDPATGGLSGNFTAASAGGGVRFAFWDKVTTDFSVAKAIEGPRDDTRFFFIVGAKY
jgi:hemolysin activation/secretion protein